MLTNQNQSILNHIGKTPLVEIKKLNPYRPEVKIFAKAEFLNPTGSIKDRMVFFAVNKAEKNGFLKPGMVLVEATTGNTGISLAWIGLIKGYRVKLVVPKKTSKNKLKFARFLEAELVLVDNKKDMKPVWQKADELAKQENCWLLDQFRNLNNPAAFAKFAWEIKRQISSDVDFFVAGVGTGGSLTGAGKKLKTKNQKLKVIAVEPAESAVLSGKQPGEHQIEGIGEGFIPPLVDLSLIDQVVGIESEVALEMTKELAVKEGLLVGTSSGANVAAALKIASQVKQGVIVTVLPDRVERYL